ncbi:MAG: hypothetical protein IPN94_25530 [Sphingobacteriales bacterium]|nr:hypothetical protein [Sphingobacteriales bacterium]
MLAAVQVLPPNLTAPPPVTASITLTNPFVTEQQAAARSIGQWWYWFGLYLCMVGWQANGSSVTGIVAGSISVTVSDANSCTATATATLNPPTRNGKQHPNRPFM